jgi:hypothetical protein
MLPTRFRSIWPSCVDWLISKKSFFLLKGRYVLILSQSINKHGHHRWFLFLIGWFLKNQVSYHLAKRFQRKSCFRNRPIRNKNCLWRPCLLMDQNGMSNSHRGPSIDVIRNLVGSIYGKSSYKDCSFCPNLLTNMAGTNNSFFWLVNF